MQFQKQSVSMVVFFTIITLGIYPAAWLYGYRDAFNSLQSHTKLSLSWIAVAVALYSIDAALLLLMFIVPDPTQVKAISDIARVTSLCGSIAVLFESLKCRQILDDHYNGAEKKNVKLSYLLTVFFTVAYLQHKINTLLELGKSPQK